MPVRTSRVVPNGPRARLSIVLCAALVGCALPAEAAVGRPEPPDPPRPGVASVTATLDRLARRAARLTEQFDAATIAVDRTARQLDEADSRSQAADARLRSARARFHQLVMTLYEGDGLGPGSALLTTNDPGGYLATLAAADQLTRYDSTVVSSLRTARTQARRSHASALADHAKAINARRDLAARLRAVRAATAQYRQLLARLNAAQRQAYLRRDDARTSPKPGAVPKRRAGLPPAPNPAARTAVVYAEAQVGKPYVFGAAGPSAFDCSGLTMMAWRAAGVDLPHLTTLQIRRGHPVSWNDLAPGDLIFLYPDVGHVEIYVGAGLAVSAPQPGENVKYVEIARHRSDFVGAIRLP